MIDCLGRRTGYQAGIYPAWQSPAECLYRTIQSNREMKYDWLGQYIFTDLAEVQEQATRWLWHYNNERPNIGLGGITPRQKLAVA